MTLGDADPVWEQGEGDFLYKIFLASKFLLEDHGNVMSINDILFHNLFLFFFFFSSHSTRCLLHLQFCCVILLIQSTTLLFSPGQ